MAASPTPAVAEPLVKQRATLVYDGDCGFCTTSAMWIGRRLHDDIRVEMWQALDIEALGLSVEDVSTAAYFVDADGSLHRGHAGIGRALEHTNPVFRIAGKLMQHRPISWVAAPIYALVAKYRYKLPGSTDACRIR